MDEQLTLFDKNEEYNAFVEKFKPKKTTDDCYTPPIVYDAVRDWACKEYGIDPACIVRPFYPGGDYEKFTYPDGCVVLDNPPFSILSKICEFYLDRDISFFLFAPSLTALSGRNVAMRMNHIICDADITYENGAVVHTAFVTSFGGDVVVQSAPTLRKAIADAIEQIKASTGKTLPKYEYPDYVLTAAMVQRYAKYGIDFAVRRSECELISALDEQRKNGKTIFGGGLLLSESAASRKYTSEKTANAKAEAAVMAAAADALRRSAAARTTVKVWQLSDREWERVQRLSQEKQKENCK